MTRKLTMWYNKWVRSDDLERKDPMVSRGVKIVSSEGSGHRTDVYDLETNAKLLNVYSIDFQLSRAMHRVTIETSDPFVYEGPADLVDPTYLEVVESAEEVVSTYGQDNRAIARLAGALHVHKQIRNLPEEGN